MRSSQKAVEVLNLEKKFGHFTAVNRISFDVYKGEIFGFLGPNGAGKSTTIRMLCGILTPTSGTGHVNGYDIMRESPQIKQNIGYMSQKFSLYQELTVEENINFYSGLYAIPRQKKNERKEWAITMAGLESLKKSPTRILSGGWKQRLALGCAILHEPAILFLDEPTSGVDPIARQDFWSLIQQMAQHGITVFVTTHYMDEAEHCDRLALMYNGSIIAMGTPHELKTTAMRGDVLEISIPHPETWIHPFLQLKNVREAALFGTTLHIVVDNAEQTIPIIEEQCAKQGMNDYTIHKIMPSLEDVFVSLIDTYKKTEHGS